MSGTAAGVDEGLVTIAIRIAGFQIDVIVASGDSGDIEGKVAFELAIIPFARGDGFAAVELKLATGDFPTGAGDVIEIVAGVLGFGGDDVMGVGWRSDWVTAASTGRGSSLVEDTKSTDVDGAAAFGLDGEGMGASSKITDFTHLVDVIAGSSFEGAKSSIFKALGWESQGSAVDFDVESAAKSGTSTGSTTKIGGDDGVHRLSGREVIGNDFRGGIENVVLLWVSVRGRSGHRDTGASKACAFSDKLSVVVSWNGIAFGKDGDDGIEGASLNADSKKGVVALVGEGGAWHGIDLIHVVLDIVLTSGSADLSLLADVAEVREKVVLIELILGDAKEAAKKVGA